MVDAPRLISPEIAETYGVSLSTVTKTWMQHPEWPGSTGKRGRFKEYDAAAVDKFVQDHAARPTVDLEPERLYTAQELEEADIGVTAGTIRADRSRDRWPEPDNTAHGVNRWRGSTVTQTMSKRRSYRRSSHGDEE
ncbi:hypothetical protein [Streptomyces sp. TRM68367]|uniref:hypothetical protein n=1 Tax=Streptomyces sp. TRM68367 TaxID=2758415 RepID=UPI00165BCAFD|nr:hypothetical protein [Streptomyces sp. TRM68367]MBC9730690.1 hypothetical protein [Streptomyces sp. TRM68367]